MVERTSSAALGDAWLAFFVGALAVVEESGGFGVGNENFHDVAVLRLVQVDVADRRALNNDLVEGDAGHDERRVGGLGALQVGDLQFNVSL